MLDRFQGSRVRRILFGANARGVRNVTVALLGWSLVFVLLFRAAISYRRPFEPLMDMLWWELGALLVVGIAAAVAYRFGGLAHSWLVGFGPPFGAMMNMLAVGFGMGADTGPLDVLGIGLLAGVTGAIVLGTPGYLIGSFLTRRPKG